MLKSLRRIDTSQDLLMSTEKQKLIKGKETKNKNRICLEETVNGQESMKSVQKMKKKK